MVPNSHLIRIEFIVIKGSYLSVYNPKFKLYTMYSEDNTKEFRRNFQSFFNLPYLGLFFTIYSKPAAYKLLNEWLVYDVSKLTDIVYDSFDLPHVVVFDMDSTLITEEEEVSIRDPAVYESLEILQNKNCVLCLWSYGDKEHVIDSLQKLNLKNYFTVILAEGNNSGEYFTTEGIDYKYDVFYQSTPFYLNIESERVPKSPRVVLWYLTELGINFIKSITLVDDLRDNDYNYDHFVHVTRCETPTYDWLRWHKEIISFINDYDKIYNQLY
ncbi:38K protein [Hyphantria cunea granulovirus]|uniref:38K protein n=1 Tax=Hyphantria cunea granulovirus TaxID=307448 RepID=A0AAF1D290_9BBAC|nr:38K protein [Hyphantria cunea granulovirus]QBQ01630.1 38K protein [Hyphantria cunea granulovirus]